MNFYKKIWNTQLSQHGWPSFYKGLTKVDFKDFKKELDNDSEDFAKKIIHDLIDGKVILIKSAFSKDFVLKLKKMLKSFGKLILMNFIKC